MFFYCFIIFSCLDVACLFPLQNCNADTKTLLAVLDCRGEVEAQKYFIETFSKYIQRNTRTWEEMNYSFTMMTGNQCSQNVDIELHNEFKYKDTLPVPLVLNETRQWKEMLDSSCLILAVSFVFLFNISDINNKMNPMINDILNNENDSRAYNRFFIIQSTEIPNYVYSSMDYFHFTSSFKNVRLEEIFYKICDMKIEKNTLPLTIRSNGISSFYRMVTSLSEISYRDARCLCNRNDGMRLLSLESYHEYISLLPYLNYTLNTKSKIGINIYLGLEFTMYKFRWENGNPYLFSHPSRILHDKACFYLHLSAYAKFTIFIEKNLYNLGRYIIEIDCNKTLHNSLIVCEGENDITNRYIYLADVRTQNLTVTDTFILTRNQLRLRFDVLRKKSTYIPRFSYNCNFDARNTSMALKNDLCSNYFNPQINYVSNNTRNNLINLIQKGKTSFYTFKKVDISKCQMFNECQTISFNTIDYESSNLNVDIFCVDDKNNKTFNDTCSIPTVNLKLNLEYFQCESDKSQYSLKCIKDNFRQCKDSSHLRNCENFICPEPFLKCFNSYCIFPKMIHDDNFDCPYGEDKIRSNTNFVKNLCEGDFKLEFRDICLDFISFNELLPTIQKDTQFICEIVCPMNYKCVSSKIDVNFFNKSTNQININQFHIRTNLYIIANVIMPIDKLYILDSHLYDIVLFEGRKCKLNNFDKEFHFWEFKNLITLDISSNNINHSKTLRSVERLSKLKYLNLSHNKDLVIDQWFNFPRSLEIIDLSHTKIQALRNQVFGDLINLRHLNLSHTFITNFKDMGLPEYFTLDTLYIQYLKMQNIDTDFFKGLTINSELMASDFVICCPQILNTNISTAKCHAITDAISSCKHLVGDTFKRIIIWIVGFLTLVGNGIVLVYRIGWNREIFKKAYGLFITGLAVSDFIMGVYLIIIASVDTYYKDDYVFEDFKWRISFLCSFCGFMSTLSSETSTFFICLITLDRFLCITYPFGEHRFSKTGKLLSFTLVWFVGFVLALIPVVLSDWEIYSSNGLCLALPLRPTQNNGWVFSFLVYVCLNFVLFLLIAIGQASIFLIIVQSNTSIPIAIRNSQRKSENLNVAKKLAFIAVTDFCCWFPVGIFGILSLNGYIFNREVYAWIAVFVLPINSALNPIIYTIPVLYSKCKSLRGLSSITTQSEL